MPYPEIKPGVGRGVVGVAQAARTIEKPDRPHHVVSDIGDGV